MLCAIRPHGLAYFLEDAASTEDTVDILKSYGDQLGWSSEPGSSQACTVDRGFTRIVGDIMAYSNSNDVLLHAASNTSRAFQDELLDVVYCHRICRDENSRQTSVWICPGIILTQSNGSISYRTRRCSGARSVGGGWFVR